MADHILPEKVRVLNNATRYPVTFQDTAYATVAANIADQVSIQGFGLTKIAQVTKASLTRGRVLRNQKLSITAATLAQITVTGPIPNNTIIRFRFLLETTRRQSVLERPEYEFGRWLTFNVNANTGDTAGVILAKLYNSIVVEAAAKNRDLLIGSGSNTAGTFVNGRATTLTVLELEALLLGSFVKEIQVIGQDGLPSSVVTVFAPVTSQALVQPIGWGSDLEFTEKLQKDNNLAYHFDIPDLFVEDEYYTEINWEFQVGRVDPSSPNLSNTVKSVIYLRESTCEALIDNLADFFDQSTGTVTYNAIVAGVYTFNATLLQFKANA